MSKNGYIMPFDFCHSRTNAFSSIAFKIGISWNPFVVSLLCENFLSKVQIKKYIDKSQYIEHNLICIVKVKCNLKFLVKLNFNFLYNLDYLWTFTWNSNVSLLYDNFPAIMQIKNIHINSICNRGTQFCDTADSTLNITNSAIKGVNSESQY